MYIIKYHILIIMTDFVVCNACVTFNALMKKTRETSGETIMDLILLIRIVLVLVQTIMFSAGYVDGMLSVRWAPKEHR